MCRARRKRWKEDGGRGCEYPASCKVTFAPMLLLLRISSKFLTCKKRKQHCSAVLLDVWMSLERLTCSALKMPQHFVEMNDYRLLSITCTSTDSFIRETGSVCIHRIESFLRATFKKKHKTSQVHDWTSLNLAEQQSPVPGIIENNERLTGKTTAKLSQRNRE